MGPEGLAVSFFGVDGVAAIIMTNSPHATGCRAAMPWRRRAALLVLGIVGQLAVNAGFGGSAAAQDPASTRGGRIRGVVASLVRLPSRDPRPDPIPAVLLTLIGPRTGGGVAQLVAPTLDRARGFYADALLAGGVGEKGSELIEGVRRGPSGAPPGGEPRRVLVVVDPLAIPAMVGLAPSPMPVQRFFEWHLALPPEHPAVASRDTPGMKRALAEWVGDPCGHMEVIGLNRKGEYAHNVDREGLAFALLSGLRRLLRQAVRDGVHTLLVQTSAGALERHYRLEYGLQPFAEIADGTGRVPDPRRRAGDPSAGAILDSVIMRAPAAGLLASLDDRLAMARRRPGRAVLQLVRSLSADELARVFRGEASIAELDRATP